MGIRLRRSKLLSVAIILLLISVTVALPYTTESVRFLSIQIRVISLALTALTLGLLAVSVRVNRLMLLSMSAFIGLYVYGVLMAIIMGGISTAVSDLPTTFILTLLGLFITSQRRFVVTRGNAHILVIYILAFMGAMIVLGGFNMSIPPHFVFSLLSEKHGATLIYSQGVSNFFGLGLVLCGFIVQSERSAKLMALYLALSALCLLLSLLGGGRGDALAALLVFLFIVMFRMPLKSKIATIIVMVLLGWLFISKVNFGDLVIVRRLSILLEGSAGARDEIYSSAITLLMDRFQCVTIGCGFDYYQYALQHEASRYPHNQLLEAAIVWGLPLTGTLIVFFAIGLYKSIRENGNYDAFPFIALYFVIVAMKSGSVISSWVFIISVFHYFGVGLSTSVLRATAFDGGN